MEAVLNPNNPRNWLTQDEIRGLLQKSDWRAAWEILFTWLLIAGSFALVAVWPNPLTVIVALLILGGRQLALAILMHDLGHKAFFKTKSLDFPIGRWFAAWPIFHDIDRYRPYHLQHHSHTGTPDDPDLNIANAYPVKPASFRRKVFRDFIGASGLRNYIGVFMMHFGYLTYSLGGVAIKERPGSTGRALRNGAKRLWGPLLVNGAMFGILWALGHPLLYLLWVGAMFTTQMFALRIRAMAEHAATPPVSETNLYPTRTTKANFVERLLFAPHHVNYHVEHHLLMTVPSYNLPRMHRLLVERGFYQQATLANSYWDVLRHTVRRAPKLAV